MIQRHRLDVLRHRIAHVRPDDMAARNHHRNIEREIRFVNRVDNLVVVMERRIAPAGQDRNAATSELFYAATDLTCGVWAVRIDPAKPANR